VSIAPETAKGIVRRFAQVTFVLLLQATVLFLAAGTPRWIWAWTYLGISLAVALINGTIMLRTSPETIAERGDALSLAVDLAQTRRSTRG
jgi:hypothetical protein